MLVKDVMNAHPITVQADDSVSEAARRLRENKISGMPVLEGERLVGIVSESDLLKLLAVEEDEGSLWLPSPFEIFEVPFRDLVKWERMRSKAEDISTKKVREVMSRSLHEVSSDETVEEAAAIMTRHRINRLPVIDGGRLVGILTRGDIISGLGKGS
ncbi:MAG: Inosine-5'-monophosphate dehydrogenase [Methanosaeta sp. PtaU1.Bin060]|nr:MAG: Inosine-5'-monophosphate dehydrogenase [Methanosaeta sp. PtaU1.Bin060]